MALVNVCSSPRTQQKTICRLVIGWKIKIFPNFLPIMPSEGTANMVASQKNGWYTSQILRAVKSIEALEINKYLNPGYFFLCSYRFTHDSECQKSSMLFFQDACQQVASSRAQCQGQLALNVRMPTTSTRARQCFCCVSHAASITSQSTHARAPIEITWLYLHTKSRWRYAVETDVSSSWRNGKISIDI
jgi:hypothetical protein